MFLSSADGIYRSSLLAALDWVEHGFGSRNAVDWPGDYVSAKQIHSNTVLLADAQSAYLGEGDAIVTPSPRVRIGVRTADCVPILIADKRQRIVAAVHAGWRGTAAGIATATVDKMRQDFQSDPADLVAALGPSIAYCCFEVGPEVAARFKDWRTNGDSTHVDLVNVTYRQLLKAGVNSGHIDISGLCTACTPGEFHSYRRDRDAAGRMVAAIAIR